jgi:small subunit ribosomal protein S18
MAQQRSTSSRPGTTGGRPGQSNSRDPRGQQNGGGGYQGGRGGQQNQQQNQRDPLKKKPDPFKVRDITYVDYRDIRILERFLNDRGKLLPNRITGLTAKGQRMLETSVKHARHLALLPFVAEGMK